MIDDRKILLLNSDYQALRFVNWQRALKLLFRNKVEVVSEWDGVEIRSTSGAVSLPSILRLKCYVKRHKFRIKFSKGLVKKRDRYTCQYCGKKGKKELTIDHVVPISKGGKSTFENCVTACFRCNSRKNCYLLSEIDMNLLKKPTKPTFLTYTASDLPHRYHPTWKMFIKSLQI